MNEIKPVYQVLRSCEWEDGDREDYDYFKRINENYVRILYPAAAYEALQKENAELKEKVQESFVVNADKNLVIFGSKESIHAMNGLALEAMELREANAAQAKRIEELEAATEHLGLTPQQAADGLARHKAQVAEIESLRKQVDEIKRSNTK